MSASIGKPASMVSRRTRILCLAFPILACLSISAPRLSAQPVSPQQASATQARYPVTGIVVNSVTNEPIRHALVQIPPFRTTFSDSDGKFEFDDIPAGTVGIVVRKPGFFDDAQNSGASVKVGSDSTGLTLRLDPEGIIRVRVLDVSGRPLENVPVRLMSHNIQDGRRQWGMQGNGTTNPDGKCRFANLHSGTYYLAAGPLLDSMRRGLYMTGPSKIGYPETYYPASPDQASASPIQLTTGQQTELNLTLSAAPVFEVSGTVSGYPGEGGAALMAFDESGENLPIASHFSFDTGQFHMYLVSGNYVLKAFARIGAETQLRADAPIHVAGDMKDVHLTLQTGISIPINVTVESGAPSDQKRTFGIVNPVPQVHLIPTRKGCSDAYSSAQGRSSGRPSIALRDVDPCTYTAEISPQGPWYVQSATLGSADLLREEVTITSLSAGQSLNIVLSGDTGSLEGTVKSGDADVQRGYVLLVSDKNARAEPRTSLVNEGQFHIPELAPGDYRVYAFDQIDNIEYRNPEALSAYDSDAAHVSITPNGSVKVMLNLIKTGE